jgi:hypothetical protein
MQKLLKIRRNGSTELALIKASLAEEVQNNCVGYNPHKLAL